MPRGLTDIVDQRCSLGGPKYPDLEVYTVFSLMEKIFPWMMTPVNFSMFGGMLMEKICVGMMENPMIASMCSVLLTMTSSPRTQSSLIIWVFAGDHPFPAEGQNVG